MTAEREALVARNVLERLLDYALVHDTGLVEHADAGRQSPLVSDAKSAIAAIDQALANPATIRDTDEDAELDAGLEALLAKPDVEGGEA